MMKEAITWQKYKRLLRNIKHIEINIYDHTICIIMFNKANKPHPCFRCVQLHNVWWQQIPIPHCSWEK
jgi:hypothetical protein